MFFLGLDSSWLDLRRFRVIFSFRLSWTHSRWDAATGQFVEEDLPPEAFEKSDDSDVWSIIL